jgi:hypothetical protein
MVRDKIPLLPVLFRDSTLVMAVLSSEFVCKREYLSASDDDYKVGFALTVPYTVTIQIETHTIYP